MDKPSILVTFDSMKNDNCGYYYFGIGLGEPLAQKCRDRYHLTYYLHQRTKYKFQGPVNILRLSKLHNFYFRPKNRFDLVHFSDQNFRLHPHMVNAKKIMTIHDMNKVHLKYSTPARIKIFVEKLRKSIAQMDRVVAISEFVANDVRAYFPEATDKLSVIYNGADKLTVQNNYQPAVIPKGKFLFTVGLLSPQKGFHHLPALLEGNEYELVISGIETPHKERILEQVEKYNCTDRVHITGPISDDDKAWYYQNCSAFLFPSIAEGFGLPVIEAMHFGKPCFLAKYTSLPEVGGNVAYYFDNFDPGHMQDVFAKGMQDFTDRKPEEAIVAQSEKFSWSKAADQYIELYRECLNE